MKTECGIFAIFWGDNRDGTDSKIRDIINYGMNNIQHRGQDGFGWVILSSQESQIYKQSGLLPADIFQNTQTTEIAISSYPDIFLGHLRYSTNTITEKIGNNQNLSGESGIQPLELDKLRGIYIAHNGNLPNLKVNLIKLGIPDIDKYFKPGMSDTYIFKSIWQYRNGYGNGYGYPDISNSGIDINMDDVIEYIRWILKHIPGAYSCVMTYCPNQYDNPNHLNKDDLNKDDLDSLNSSQISSISQNSEYNAGSYLIGFRDRWGFKPLSICRIAGRYCFVSESVQIPVDGEFIRDVMPGEIWIIRNNTMPELISGFVNSGLPDSRDIHDILDNDIRDNDIRDGYMCSMEVIYFMKRETRLFNGVISVDYFRKRLGIELAKQDSWMDMDIYKLKSNSQVVIAYIPESAGSIAEGYAGYSGIMLRNDLILKIENIRSFIENSTDSRIGKIKRKFAFNIDDIKGLESIILVDDSIVRGNTMKYIIQILKEINPLIKIHVRIGSPALIRGCHFGIDLYDDELIVPQVVKMGLTLEEYFGIESVIFLDRERLNAIFQDYGMGNCGWCFGIDDAINKSVYEW